MVQALIDYEKKRIELEAKISELEEEKRKVQIKDEVKDEVLDNTEEYEEVKQPEVLPAIIEEHQIKQEPPDVSEEEELQEAPDEVLDDLNQEYRGMEHFYQQTSMPTYYQHFPGDSYHQTAIGQDYWDDTSTMAFGRAPHYSENGCQNIAPQNFGANANDNMLRSSMLRLPSHGYQENKARQDIDRALGSQNTHFTGGTVPQTFTRQYFGTDDYFDGASRNSMDHFSDDEQNNMRQNSQRDARINEASGNHWPRLIDDSFQQLINNLNKARRSLISTYSNERFGQNMSIQTQPYHNRINDAFDSQTPQFVYDHYEALRQNYEENLRLNETFRSQILSYGFPQNVAIPFAPAAFNANMPGGSSNGFGYVPNEAGPNPSGSAMEGYWASTVPSARIPQLCPIALLVLAIRPDETN